MMKPVFAGLIGLTTVAGVLLAEEKNKPEPPPPAATITLLDRHGYVLPHRQGSLAMVVGLAGSSNIIIARPHE